MRPPHERSCAVGGHSLSLTDDRVEVKVLGSSDRLERTGEDPAIWLRGTDGLEVAGADWTAWDAAVASFNKALRNGRGRSGHLAAAGDADRRTAPPAASTIDVLGLAELRRRTR